MPGHAEKRFKSEGDKQLDQKGLLSKGTKERKITTQSGRWRHKGKKKNT